MPARRTASNGATSGSTKRAKNYTTMQRRRPMAVSRVSRPLSFGKTSLPMSIQNTLRYVEDVSITVDGVGKGTYVFSCNGLYDPNITGTGHQPLYFDQYMALYRHYTVMKSKIKVTPLSSDEAAPGKPYELCIFIDDDATLPGSAAWREQVSATTKVVSTFDQVGQGSSVVKYWNAQITYGGNVVDNDELRGDVGSNPTEQSYYVVNAVSATPLSTQTFLVELEYTVVWHEHVSVAAS